MVKNLKIIKGNSHYDDRGEVAFINDFDMSDIKRLYTISNKDVNILRAWQGHKIESKFLKVIQGSFIIGCVLIDNWENPSDNLKPDFFKLTCTKNEILCIPPGYANGIKALEMDSKLMSFSDLTIDEAKNDNYKFKNDKWINCWPNL